MARFSAVAQMRNVFFFESPGSVRSLQILGLRLTLRAKLVASTLRRFPIYSMTIPLPKLRPNAHSTNTALSRTYPHPHFCCFATTIRAMSTTAFSSSKTLKEKLVDLFGFPDFRAGQRPIVEAVLQKKDSAVFWATGTGKSLCYQFPPLYLNKTAIVVSPLISLMQDQVIRLNTTVGMGKREVACFLGSSQLDPTVEKKALNGEYAIVFLSPEKLRNGFLDQLSALISRDGLCLFAVDESHCVCEWGHDFRVEYQQLGVLRKRYPHIPVMVLTATAGERERIEIISSLGLRDPVVERGSVDRPNLVFSVKPKLDGQSTAQSLQPLASKLRKSPHSTIIYVPTRANCESIRADLAGLLTGTDIVVDIYHAGLSAALRKQVHVGFLSGSIHVVVATVAFGMGIDKPDIRRVVHYGPPKTFEAYYQQVGRAGRDGALAECELFFSNPDFVNYTSEFYMGALKAEARSAAEHSLSKLREYANDTSQCRRHLIVKYFGEKSTLEACGQCDNCTNKSKYDGDLERDYTNEACIILKAAGSTTGHYGTSGLLQIVMGTFKGKGYVPDQIARCMQDLEVYRTALPKRRTVAFFKALFPSLLQKGYLVAERRSMNTGGYDRAYESIGITQLGRDVLSGLMGGRTPKLMLEVPPQIREAEVQAKIAQEQRRSDLVKSGIDLSMIPETQIETGTGPIICAHLHWIRSIKRLRTSGRERDACNLETLLQRILQWREQTAKSLLMAPSWVLPEHLARQLAYSQPTQLEAISQIGVRIANVEMLQKVIVDWCEEFGKRKKSHLREGEEGTSDPVFELPVGKVRALRASVPNSTSKKPPTWSVSFDRWTSGDHMQLIATTQTSGKPIQVNTVFGHLMKALSFGYPVDLRRMFSESDVELPTKSVWDRLQRAECSAGVDVTDSSKGFKKDLLRCILPADLVDADYQTKTPEQKAIEASWYPKMDAYAILRMVNAQVRFTAPAERPAKRTCLR